jgi:hypothetical protein
MNSLPTVFLPRLMFACAAMLTTPAAATIYYRNGPPKITTQPVGGTFEQGQTITLKVTPESFTSGGDKYSGYVSGSDYDPHYQWMKNNERITGATATTLTLSNAQPSNSAVYTVIVSNKYGWVSSTAATITVIVTYLPSITAQPMGATRYEGESASLEVNAVGVPAPTYRWRKNGTMVAGATLSRLALSNLQGADAGSYDVLITNSRGTVMSRTVALTVLIALPPSTIAPTTILAQPKRAQVNPNEAVRLTVSAAGEGLAYQWKKDGIALAGATGAALTISGATTSDTGFYSVVIKGDNGTTESDLAIVIVSSASSSRLINLSTRAFVPAGTALTPGFTLRGTSSKSLLVRAVGPTLARFGVASVLANPRFDLIPAGEVRPLLANDDWTAAANSSAIADTTAAVGGFALEANSKDAAALATLNTSQNSSYTVRITSGNADESGIVLAEVYDVNPLSDDGQLAAVSTLAFTGSGDRALVAGFTIEGEAPKTLLLRAIGPSLETFGVTGAIANPQISLVASKLNRVVARNDNAWSGDAALNEAFARTGAFPLARNSRDAALLVTLPPGAYTVQVKDAADAEGTTLLEIYDVP